jgi:hypothetical protein
MPFRRWFPNICLALAVATFIKTFPARADDNPCIPLAVLLSKIADDSRLVEIRVLSGAKLLHASNVFSQATETEIPWGAAYLAIRSDGWAQLVMGFEDVVCTSVTVSPDGLRMFLKEIDGQAV